MKKEDVEAWIKQAADKIKGCKSADEHFYGFRDGATALLDWLISEGVIDR